MTRFFGMYRVKLYHLRRNVKFVIMNSVYYTDKFLQTFYDLKGSTVGRDAKPGDAVKKDNDLRKGLPEEALVMRPTIRQRVKEQILLDCSFFEDVGAMDYSLLVGVHHIPHSDSDSLATSGFQGSRSSVRVSRKQLLEDIEHTNSHTTVNNHEDDGSIELSIEEDSGPKALKSVNTAESPPAKGHMRQLSESIGNFFLENGLDDDDNSYLIGSSRRPAPMPSSPNHDSEEKKLATIEKLYWPFHRLFDIHGHRRMISHVCPKCHQGPCSCHDAEDAKVLSGYNVPKFVPPLSERKDAGFEMDTTGFSLPMTYKSNNGNVPCDGRIFYIGIIDVLQEYTTRKALESQYRYMQTHGRPEASCVPPSDYSERFIGFFDQVTSRDTSDSDGADRAVAIGKQLKKLSTVGEDPNESGHAEALDALGMKGSVNDLEIHSDDKAGSGEGKSSKADNSTP